MDEKLKLLLENNLILENNSKLLELEIYNKAFKELDKKIKKIMNEYNNKIDYDQSINELIIEQNRIISALSML
jgi:hypothetical protein